ncbi:RAB6A-GEF complex partner protein 2 isoform X2 [Stomoxys calcitrans]|uniref:Arrestin-like N-terminal domain-containing protein n=1 Tax=Stomoxys calcitrans TaxID=35570 RepID=A0A1I8PJ07_STOCA|nr:RAB6A-GEF complex partner protein 2 isoform X2 [Stomoxys calcitrans]
MIEIKARLVRTDSIYATGEYVECLIEFIHKIPSGSVVNNEILESLAWASVQLHCYRKTNISNQDKMLEMVGKTALDAVTQAPGDVVVATKPKILFCDLKLQPNESKTYFFNELVPRDGPPTYRGHDIKYFYKLTIATQRVKSKVQTLTVPIRVLPIPLIARTDELPITEETNDELAPTNPFLEKKEISELEISWHHLKNVTARRAPKFYRISNKRGYVGRFCLFKPAYKLGEDIVGSLDFANCKVRCVQFSVKLQLQEIMQNNGGNRSSNNDFNDNSSVNSLDLASVASGVGSEYMHKSSTSASSKDNEGKTEPTGKVTTHAISHQKLRQRE